MNDGLDIDAQYKSLFGHNRKHVILFDDNDEWNDVRRYITSSPPEDYDRNVLPFENVKVEIPSKELIRSFVEYDNHIVVHDLFENSRYSERLFYISKRENGKWAYNAVGHLDNTRTRFILLSGSVLSHDVSKSYRFTNSEMSRRRFIKSHCSDNGDGYTLKHDCDFQSVHEAAKYVVGDIVNGLNEWKDKDGDELGYVLSSL